MSFDKRAPRTKTLQSSPSRLVHANAKRLKFTKVKTAKGRRLSSTLWLQRQLNDPYVIAAQEMGYRSRAAFKLSDIQEKFNLIQKGDCVLDLGAAPGGWSQLCVDYTAAHSGSGRVIALDCLEMEAIPYVDFYHGDFTDVIFKEKIFNLFNDKIDVVISDMAPFTTGVQTADHIRILTLAEEALLFAKKTLKQGGHFATKLFEGGDTNAYIKEIKTLFKQVKHFKPASSRSNSSELFIVALDFIA